VAGSGGGGGPLVLVGVQRGGLPLLVWLSLVALWSCKARALAWWAPC